MARAELLLSAALAALAAATFLHVGLRLARRPVPKDMRHATRAFAAWWFGVGAYALLAGGLPSLLAAFSQVDLRLFATVQHVAFPLLLASLACLTYYFAFLFTGSRAALPWVAGAYALAYAFVVSLVALRRPVGVEIGAWSTHLVYEPALEGAPLLALLAILAVPQVVGALAYLAFALRAGQPDARWRALLVAVSLVAWFTSTFLAEAFGAEELEFLTRPVLGVGAALCALWAYEPPAWVERRLSHTTSSP